MSSYAAAVKRKKMNFRTGPGSAKGLMAVGLQENKVN